jgi:hypothetical protein
LVTADPQDTSQYELRVAPRAVSSEIREVRLYVHPGTVGAAIGFGRALFVAPGEAFAHDVVPLRCGDPGTAGNALVGPLDRIDWQKATSR